MIFYPVVVVVVVPFPVFVYNNFYGIDQLLDRPGRQAMGFLAHPPGHLPIPAPVV
jgi:hypothetical protein